jgi:hypothetical protein
VVSGNEEHHLLSIYLYIHTHTVYALSPRLQTLICMTAATSILVSKVSFTPTIGEDENVRDCPGFLNFNEN